MKQIREMGEKLFWGNLFQTKTRILDSVVKNYFIHAAKIWSEHKKHESLQERCPILGTRPVWEMRKEPKIGQIRAETVSKALNFELKLLCSLRVLTVENRYSQMGRTVLGDIERRTKTVEMQQNNGLKNFPGV